MAIEDAASIAQLLPADTDRLDVPDRLRLYNDIRKERVEWVQDQSRINGRNEETRPASESFPQQPARRIS